MKIAFFTEGNWYGNVPRNHPNLRTDLAWMAALNATHYPLDARQHNIPEQLRDIEYDLGIVIIPKKVPQVVWNSNRVVKCNKIAVMQEGPHWFFQDYDISTQFSLIEYLNDCDFLLCHNEYDRKYYQGIFTTKSVYILPTLMLEDPILQDRLCREDQRSGTMIGGNFVSWYGGFDSTIVAGHLQEQIYAPSMGRKQKDEERINGIEYVPYISWQEWITELSKRKYAVHMMKTYAAGTFALNCAYLGIPCIGYLNLDTQSTCFPELSVEEGDIEKAIRLAKHLKENKQFYNHVSAYAKKAWRENFSEDKFMYRVKDYIYK